jgi:hypothetical protein
VSGAETARFAFDAIRISPIPQPKLRNYFRQFEYSTAIGRVQRIEQPIFAALAERRGELAQYVILIPHATTKAKEEKEARAE